ncbi:SpvB/TcaC N-terminal domain-containing protein [Microbispora rosea]|uniref:SpvB/TcaC N-terminal domain-containing protein n=1 Tax=Microbispora rosea TaxID=58117 RepID=UPI00343DC589
MVAEARRGADRRQGADAGPAGDDAPLAAPSLSLPKGGGAIRGIGEKLSANPVTGTGTVSVPISISPGRSGFGPRLELGYDSGAGNGPFGLGWSLSLPAISRKTDKGLPRYQEHDGPDVFVLSGAEDLVPELEQQGDGWKRAVRRRTRDGVEYTVSAYRPRTEGLFARIERWTDVATGDTHWCSISRENVTTLYGRDLRSRISDPFRPERVLTWLICESWDDRGNWIVYDYKPEDSTGVRVDEVHERNRSDLGRSANRYPKRIRYGNRVSREVRRDPERAGWMFEVVFDYGEHDEPAPSPGDGGAWHARRDPFSSYRAGFEVRTYRLCRRVLMFHHFDDDPAVGHGCLVRSTDFTYRGAAQDAAWAGDPVVSLLATVTHAGYRRRGTGYARAALPTVDFGYTSAEFNGEVRELTRDAMENLPQGVDGSAYRLVDLDGEGVPGVLSPQEDCWLYKPNLGDGRFGPVQVLASRPATGEPDGMRGQLLDLAGDGRLDVVDLDGPLQGFYERTSEGHWDRFTPFAALPTISWSDPNLRFVDLTGDGLADVLITEDDALVWYAALGEEGFAEGGRVAYPLDEEHGPRLVFAGGEESIFLADMSGDGLTDLVRVRHGAVCYWPNLGYGRFGAKVTMDGPLDLDSPDRFDARRVRLIDVDGSGTTDLVYLGADGARIYANQAGNRWSAWAVLDGFRPPDEIDTVQAADLLGNGTGCLVWSSPLPSDAHRPLRYVDLMGGVKPHLLETVCNNLGAETRVHYAPSTRYYLADKAAGRPWVTRLPFPVHVVDRVETRDLISGNRFVTRYAYHHGHFDDAEREFRGFGLVEQFDTEEFAVLHGEEGPATGTNEDPATQVPPVLTRTWFHTGAHLDADRVSGHFAGEYYREGDPSSGVSGPGEAGFHAMLLDDTVLPTTLRRPDGSRTPWRLSAEEEREACRALRGSVLREEVYALDGTDASDRPYRIAERNHTVELLQPRAAGNRHAVFLSHPRESVEFHYERVLYGPDGDQYADPQVSHAVTLDTDVFGNVRRAVSIAYGRRAADPDPLLTGDDRAKQRTPLITCVETDYTNPVLEPDARRTPLPSESRTFELLQMTPAADGFDETGRRITPLFTFDELRTRLEEAAAPDREVPYEDVHHAGITTGGVHRRLIEHVRTRFRRDDLTGLMDVGELGTRALPGESYKLAFTPGLLADVYRRDGQNLLLTDPTVLLHGEGGYVRLDGHPGWWIPSGRVFHHPDGPAAIEQEQAFAAHELAFARENFFLPHRYVDAFGQATVVGYDPHRLQVVQSRDPVGNTVRAEYDYRVLAARQVTDPNGNRGEAAFDCLGLVVATALMGKATDDVGDSLAAFATRPELADPDLPALQAFAADPHLHSAELLDAATTRVVYDLHRFARCGQPPFAAALARETHAREAASGGGTRIQVTFVYSDGFGREAQTKVPAEPGDAPTREADIPVTVGEPARPTGDVRPGALRAGGEPTPVVRRWVGKGRTVYDNKGNPVRQYEPFFSATHLYEEEKELTETGVSPVLCYDPVGRVVVTLRPDDTYEKVVFDPWRQATWDANDSVLLDPRTDPDTVTAVAGHFADRPASWRSWYARRIGGAHGATPADRTAAKDAAAKAAAHAGTPTVAFSDSLGRAFLTVADNGPGGTLATRIELDIEGNQRVVTDARGIAVMTSDFDMLGNALHTSSPDAGERWTLLDVAGKPIRSWDGRGFRRCMTYDELRRPTAVFVADDEGERCDERTVYGEAAGAGTNHRGRVHKVFDGAGVVVSDAYDFKGNLLRSTRRLLADHRSEADWPEESDPAADALLETEAFAGATVYDALNRPLQVVAPHSGTPVSVSQPGYNDAGLLERTDVWLDQAGEPTALLDPHTSTQVIVRNIDYNARGQRTLVEYGNGVRTTYEYDGLTFRLRRLITRRGGDVLQDLTYDHDPVGNITSIRDGANDLIFHNQQAVAPGGEYRYDAVYRLVAARGREHRGGDRQVGHDPDPWTVKTLPNDGQALRNYVETYAYDQVGNILSMRHHEGSALDSPGPIVWHRRYQYATDSNRLTATSLPGDPADLPHYVDTPGYTARYAHDAHGNMTAMPHLSSLGWDDRDRLRSVDLGGGTAYYTYDSAGQRVRKIWEKMPGLVEERIYLGGFEVFRVRTNGALTLERETLHAMDGTSRIAMIESRTHLVGADPSPARLIRFQLGNHLGSVALELDTNAQVISYEEYHPYGTTAYFASRRQAETSKRYRITGKERDEETGLCYFGARYCAPWLAKWVSTDPAGLVDTVNVYAFTQGNPIKLIDADGKLSITVEGGIEIKNKRTGKLERINDAVRVMATPDRAKDSSSSVPKREVECRPLTVVADSVVEDSAQAPSVGIDPRSLDEARAQRQSRDRAEYLQEYPNLRTIVIGDSQMVGRAMGRAGDSVSGAAAAMYMARGDDPQTANAKGALVGGTMALVPAGRGAASKAALTTLTTGTGIPGVDPSMPETVLMDQVADVKSKLGVKVMVGGASSVIADGTRRTAITVSDPRADALLRNGTVALPDGVELGPPPQIGLVEGVKRLLPGSHVERTSVGYLEDNYEARGGIVTTSGGACELCSKAWFDGRFPTWEHLKWQDWGTGPMSVRSE